MPDPGETGRASHVAKKARQEDEGAKDVKGSVRVDAAVALEHSLQDGDVDLERIVDVVEGSECRGGSSSSSDALTDLKAEEDQGVSAAEFLEQQLQMETQALQRYPGKIDGCTYDLGYLNQMLFVCLTCSPPDLIDHQPAVLCYSCAIVCHGHHGQLVELAHRRHFRCDCGIEMPLKASQIESSVEKTSMTASMMTTSTSSLTTAPCLLRPKALGTLPNVENSYVEAAHNFRGLFCHCRARHVDESEDESEVEVEVEEEVHVKVKAKFEEGEAKGDDKSKGEVEGEGEDVVNGTGDQVSHEGFLVKSSSPCNTTSQKSHEGKSSCMFQCEICQDWFHDVCIGEVPILPDIEAFLCRECAQGKQLLDWLGRSIELCQGSEPYRDTPPSSLSPSASSIATLSTNPSEILQPSLCPVILKDGYRLCPLKVQDFFRNDRDAIFLREGWRDRLCRQSAASCDCQFYLDIVLRLPYFLAPPPVHEPEPENFSHDDGLIDSFLRLDQANQSVGVFKMATGLAGGGPLKSSLLSSSSSASSLATPGARPLDGLSFSTMMDSLYAMAQLKTKFTAFLEPFARDKKIVKKHDIEHFFATQLSRPKRRP